jgi:ssRNA-specific RNase YbeY (16S rRNA maturation enzyme)
MYLKQLTIKEKNMMSYREQIQKDIFEATGETDVMEIPFSRFEDKEKIVFDRVLGSINLASKCIVTEKETAQFVEKVSQLKLP